MVRSRSEPKSAARKASAKAPGDKAPGDKATVEKASANPKSLGPDRVRDRLISAAEAIARNAQTRGLLRAFYANVPPRDLMDRTPKELADTVATFLKTARERRAGRTKVIIRSPRLGQANGRSAHRIVEIINDDMPFLVDSVTAALNQQGVAVHLVIHPILSVQRDRRGILRSAESSDTDDADSHPPKARKSQKREPQKRESWIRIEIDHRDEMDEADTCELIKRVLADVRATVADWRPILRQLNETIASLQTVPPDLPETEIEEGIAFLEWLSGDNFTLLGYRDYQITGSGKNVQTKMVTGSGLGLLRNPEFHLFEGMRGMSRLPAAVRTFITQPDLIVVNKANVRSTVHRAVHLDVIGVKMFDKARRVVGERVFIGLFTSSVYTQSAGTVPLLRRKISQALARPERPLGSHAAKALQHVLFTYPRDELFQISVDDLYRIASGVVDLQERQQVALFARHDPYQRFVSCLVYTPRDSFTTNIRRRFQKILEADFSGAVTAFYTQVSDDSVLARLHFILKTDPKMLNIEDIGRTEVRLAEAARTWPDKLRTALIGIHGDAVGLRLLSRFSDAFPVAYQAAFDGAMAVRDIEHIDAVVAQSRPQQCMYTPDEFPDRRSEGVADGAFRLRIYNADTPVPLSDILPMLEDMGVRVIDETPYAVEVPFEVLVERVVPDQGRETIWIHDFGVVARDRSVVAPLAAREKFEEAFAQVRAGIVESDGLNALVLSAGLPWRDVVVLRAYARYFRQTGTPFSLNYIIKALVENPAIAASIVALFHERMALAPKGTVQQHNRRITKLEADIKAALEEVTSLDEDRILRSFMTLVQATLRSNILQTFPDGSSKPWLSFKLDSRAIADLPEPRPMVEIWVYAPCVEGVHLRFGSVARGGLRWSDRQEDFRTEILGLVKAQVVKNAVIVPVGSKGGFVVKQPPAGGDRAAQLAEGVACYQTFIRGMLDLTDNLVDGKIVPPPRVKRHDADDPYLVVAADKGTATFSDIANQLSDDYGFWLGDAFASGGSVGYDHKKMGITARGAWEAVKRHFREFGHDTQSQDFTVIGVGDMSGDVFGNGMILSRHIRLKAAFNHLHIFVDPNPDAAGSFRERQRLFRGVKGWGDYKTNLLSPGGGVFDRSAKSIPISPAMKSSFDISADKLTPNELIRSILKSQADLLWFGGIGTYVKASTESHTDAGDRSSDAVRIDATELRVSVIGEGANLGMTQPARVEFALAGGRMNTDAIDNSGGVDASDHEVNIKILLGAPVASGRLSPTRRRALLESMTDEVATLVLRDNYLQTQSLTVALSVGPTAMETLTRLMLRLERAGQLDRAVEQLPTDEMLEERAAKGQGFARPEAAVLLSYAKITIFEEVSASDLPEDPWLLQDLTDYFPRPLHGKYADDIVNHRLRREIIATAVTNSVVNRGGPAFVHDLMEQHAVDAAEIVRAYIVSRDVFEMRNLWLGVEALDNVIPASRQTDILQATIPTLKAGVGWFLRETAGPFDIGKLVALYAPVLKKFRAAFPQLLPAQDRTEWLDEVGRLSKDHLPDELARAITEQKSLISGCDIIALANRLGKPVNTVAHAYFALGAALSMDWLRETARRTQPATRWDVMAMDAVVEELYADQIALTEKVLAPGNVSARAAEDWLSHHAEAVQTANAVAEELRMTAEPSLAMFAVANRKRRSLMIL